MCVVVVVFVVVSVSQQCRHLSHTRRELISSHPSNLETVLRGVVKNELGQLRSPSNMALLAMMMHSWPDDAPKV